MTRRVHRSALVAAPAERMFELIDRVEDYPQFLPWCVATRLIERRDDLVSATVTVGWKHLRIEVTTRNPKHAPERMEIHLEGGTFRHFLGLWELRPLGSRGCKVDFTLEYELALPGADRVAGQLIDHAADRMVDAFVERAEREGELAAAARPTSNEGNAGQGPSQDTIEAPSASAHPEPAERDTSSRLAVTSGAAASTAPLAAPPAPESTLSLTAEPPEARPQSGSTTGQESR